MKRDRPLPSGLLRQALLLRPRMLDPGRRGLASAAPDVRQTLNSVIDSFAAGYNHVLVPSSAPEPASMPHELVGFAVEGAAMSSALLDILTMSRGRRLGRLAERYGARYTHLIHVGAGWAFARLHLPPRRLTGAGEPMLRWLAWDGWGFHEAFFAPDRVLHRHEVERPARGEVRAIRDQGAGRALWFTVGAEPAAIETVIAGFPQHRRCDLWAGIGLAACYTGAQHDAAIATLILAADGYEDHLAQGAAFAAKAHALSGQIPAASAACIESITGAAPQVAARWTDDCLAAVGPEPDSPAAYMQWRAEIRRTWSTHKRGALR
jgi:enediyne biosynthesis protein E3